MALWGKRFNKCNLDPSNYDRMSSEIQKVVYLRFIDHTKAFDRVRHNEIITQPMQSKLFIY